VYAVSLYYRDGRFKEQASWFKWLLGILRTAVVGLLAFLLLSPLIKSLIQNQRNPIIVMVEDSSESIAQGLKEESVAFGNQMDQLESQLQEKFDVKRLHFGDSVGTGKADTLNDKVSNISSAIKYISENYGDQNVGAIILSSDGIYNEGSNPIYQKTEINAPIYTIALGDTTKRKDLILKDIFYNKIVYLNDQFTIQADISADNCSNQRTTLEVFEVTDNGQKKLKEEKIVIKGNDFFTSKDITLNANRSGVIKYRIKLSTLSGESLTSNNSKDIVIEVLDARQKILLLANAPHPDIAALKTSILNNKNYTLDVAFAQRKDVKINDYNMVIFHNLPSIKNGIDRHITALNKRRIPRLFIVGRQTQLSGYNNQQEVLNIGGNNTQSDDIQANFNPGFSSFTVDPELKRVVSKFPPLIAPFGKYKAGAKTNSLLYQRIGRVDTDYPLLSFSDLNNTKTAVLSAEGIWKWKLADYLEHGNHDNFNSLMAKVIQFTTVKDDKRKFRADVNKNVFKENENVRVEAQLFNDSYEAVNDADVFLSLFDSKKKEYKYTFSKKDNYYNLDLGTLKEGNYSFTATTNVGGKELKDQGKFSVKSIQLEQYDLTARHDVLFDLSKKSGGKLYYPAQIDTLSSSILDSDLIKPILYTSNKTQSILNIRWILGILIILLILEWFLRRYFGTY
jgi:hypothetical protein